MNHPDAGLDRRIARLFGTRGQYGFAPPPAPPPDPWRTTPRQSQALDWLLLVAFLLLGVAFGATAAFAWGALR